MADPRALLERLATTLGRARALRAVAVALGWALLPVAVLALSHVALGFPTYRGIVAVAVVTALVAIAAPVLQGNASRVTVSDAALWVERREPRLQWTLVTLADGDASHAARLADHVRSVPWDAPALAEARRRLLRASARLGAVVAAFALALVPWRTRPEAGAAIMRGAPVPATGARALAPGAVPVTARLVPPAYTGIAARDVTLDGGVLDAIEGTRLELSGAGDAARVRVTVREAGDSAVGGTVALARDDDAWRGIVRIGTRPLAVRLADGVADRWVTIAARPDSVPEATIEAPAADVITRDTTAAIAIRGRARDDLGVRDARIEWILTTGGGEQFSSRAGTLGARTGALGRATTVAGTLSLATLGVKPGDVLHVRVVARDGNTVRGAQLGTSDTRTIRIPREEDSVAVEQLPPSPVDTSVISQRMLLVLTERLVGAQRRLARPAVVEESRRIAQLQGRLRRQVGAIVFMRTGDNPAGEHAHFAGDGHDHTAADLARTPAPRTPASVLAAADRATAVNLALEDHGDETPVVAVNRPLLEAYNAMWDATRALETVEPAEAIAPMRRALAAIQRARAAERLYLRGAPPAVVVDVARLRLTGTDSARFDPRTPLAPLPDAGATLAARLDRALVTLARDASAARDSLRLVRLDALVARPALARALDDALAALGRGADATEPLRRARRLAADGAGGEAPSPWWSGGAP
jgi:hypothetical protein